MKCEIDSKALPALLLLLRAAVREEGNDECASRLLRKHDSQRGILNGAPRSPSGERVNFEE